VNIDFFSVKINMKHIPTNREIEKVKSLCSERQRLLIDFCQQTGCRINEALRLEEKDIGEDSIVLYSRKNKKQQSGSPEAAQASMSQWGKNSGRKVLSRMGYYPDPTFFIQKNI